ncbi:MAG: tetratricopeptide repeat protein [Caldilineaceae bacterium]
MQQPRTAPDDLINYLPMDRRFALAGGYTLADRTQGAALFVDISGFTALTEALVRELGAQRGAEELTRYLNLVYDAIIDELHRYRGSVISFAGDAITCWIDGDDGLRATACALAMQNAMQRFAAVSTPAGSVVSIAMKAAIATGTVRRFLVGDPAKRVIDVLAGDTLVRLSNAEHQAKRGEVVLDPLTLETLTDSVQLPELRHDPEGESSVGVVQGLRVAVTAMPWPPLDTRQLHDGQVRVWLLPQVYERLRQGLGNFLAELRPTVALFVRFTGIDYDQDTEAGNKLDAYIRWVQGIADHYEGTLIDLNLGDKGSYLYINFGAPLAHENNADHAAAAALALVALPQDLNFITSVQIGISQGRMRAGAYGGAHHRTYGVLGDEVNLAARLMMAASPSQILLSETAQQSLSDTFIVEELPSIRVKGKSEPVAIFALQGTQQVRSGQLSVPLYALPMIGRQDELETAIEKMMLALQGQGQLLGLVGEAGIGKSRLVAEILRLATVQNFALYGGECESYGINSSYLAWQPIWRAIFGIDSGWSLARQTRTLHTQLAEINPIFVARAPILGAVLNLAIPDNELTQSLDPKLRKTLLEELLLDCLRSKARQRPLLILLEACQWLDPLSYELLETIVPAIVDLPVLLVCVSRLQEGETRLRSQRAHTQSHYTEIPISALTQTESAQFIDLKVAQLLGKETALPATVIDRLITQTEGNPFYLEELLTYLHYQGVDFQNSTALEQVELPDSLQRLMLSLLDQFSESQKITVKVASVIGRLFQEAWLAGVYPELGDSTRIHTDLDRLYQQELFLREPTEPELIYRFRQVITQSVTYESLPHALKLSLHEQIGRFIEQRYPETLDHFLDLLAYHYARSANQGKQRIYLRRAGEAAQAAFANGAALDYFTQLLPILPLEDQDTVLFKLGQIFDTIGQYGEAENRFQAALALAEQTNDPSLQAQCQIALGELRRKQSRYAEAATYFTQAQAIAEQVGDQTNLAKALVCSGSLALYQGDYATAHVRYMEGLALRRQLQEQSQVANTLSDLAITAANQGDLTQSNELFLESLAIRRSLGDQWGVANSLNNLGELALMQAQYSEALLHLEEAVAIYRNIGDKWSLGNTLLTLGNVLRAQGDYSTAYPLYQESLQIYRSLSDRRALAYILESLGGLLSLRGEAERAIRLAGAATALRETLLTPLSSTEQSQLDQALEPARQALGFEAATIVWEVGRRLSVEEAIEEALVTVESLATAPAND